MQQPPLAIVTGASGGIGACLARRLARRGYRLVLTGRKTRALTELAGELHDEAGCVVLTLDLADVDAIGPAIEGVLARHGPAEVLVNNAGYNSFRRFADLDAREHDRIMQVNYFAAATMIRQVMPGMLQRKRGWVVNVASVSAKMGPWGHSAYAASKAAMVSLTQTLAAEHPRSAGVHFCYVNPGIIDTAYYSNEAMQGLWQSIRKFAIPPDRVAMRIEKLLDRPRLELCVPWHHRVLDYLAAVSPSLAHRLVAAHSRPPEPRGEAGIAAPDAADASQ